MDTDQQPPPGSSSKLTPTQIGAGAGAAAGVLVFLVWQDTARQGPNPGQPPALFPAGMLLILGGLVVGMGIATLVARWRGRRG